MTDRVPAGPVLTVLAFTAAGCVVTSPALAVPPNIPSATMARFELDALTVQPEGSMQEYSPSQFPHWIIISGTCDTRETVLKRDGTNVTTNSACSATAGSWYSP